MNETPASLSLRWLAVLLAFFSVLAPPALAQSVTSTTLTVSAGSGPVSTVAAGTAVTLTAKVVSGTMALTTGQVNFCDAAGTYCTDIHLLATAQLTSAGTAVFKFIPGIGSHIYKAVFLGTKSYTAGSSIDSALTVTGTFPTTTTISQSTTSDNQIVLTANVTGTGDWNHSPSGAVSFLDATHANTAVATAELQAGTHSLSFAGQPAPAIANYTATVATGDFNGDGRTDMAVGKTKGPDTSTTILLGNGNGTFNVLSGPSSLQSVTSFAVADFNGDGKADLAAVNGNANNNLAILLGNGDGTFTASAPIVLPFPSHVTAGDLNGDGKADLVVLGFNSLTVLLGHGDGTFTSSDSLATGSSAAIADLNGDGKADLAVPNSSNNKVAIYLGHGNGTFTATASAVSDGPSTAIVAGDFNGDGNIDLAETNTVLLGHGDGTFTKSATLSTDVSPDSVAIGDFNADGKADLAVANNNGIAIGGTISVFLGNGDGTFTKVASPPTRIQPQSIVVADFHGNGRADLAVANAGANSVTVLLAQPTSTATATAQNIVLPAQGTNQVKASYPGEAPFASSISGAVALNSLILSSTSLSFLNQVVNTTSPPGEVLLTNRSSASTAVNGASLTGTNASEFATSNNCGTVLASASSCTIRFRFTPASTGSKTALFSLANSVTSTPLSLHLSGTGVAAPAVSLSAVTVTFGDQGVNVPGGLQTVTMTNTGGTILLIRSIVITGPDAISFASSNDCGGGLAAGGSCTIRLRFDPKTTGPKTAAVTVTDDAAASPQKIMLTGTGVNAPALTLSPTSYFVFGNQAVGTSSPLSQINLTNTGSATLNIMSMQEISANASEFQIITNCSDTLAVGASCALIFVFQPTAAGQAAARVIVTTNAADSPRTITIIGTGVLPN